MKPIVGLFWGIGIVLGYGQLPVIPVEILSYLAPIKDMLACASFIVAILVGFKQLRRKK